MKFVFGSEPFNKSVVNGKKETLLDHVGYLQGRCTQGKTPYLF